MERDMFDTMTLTKAGAAVCAALLIFLFASWGADALYATSEGGHGEEGEEHSQGYVIANLEESSEGGEEEAEVSFEEVYASADAGAGERVFNKCQSCHKLDGSNGTGPHLDGVVGRAVAGVDGFGYSDAMASHGGDWTPEALDAFLENPRSNISGTKMTFSGLKDIEDRANVIAYLAANP
ncbi:cytochrome c [Maritimibacter alkaliphilus HTCC2654]|jgi:cytochrome c|uniref:Cytochrome cy n=2 Tax=Roseobacteraceae TaxID=2854170 RepID=A3VES6_9RHOB|nr:Cytochrome cy [Rhodobacterales bacterium HTCC2654] [Maritimibacter alkaliphilus HTCC2654]TYP85167.1 cytochrome c [Maritimibacter alkaliphilus HTCC2654]